MAGERKMINLRVRPELWRAVRMESVRTGITTRAFVEDALAKALQANTPQEGKVNHA